MFKKFGFVFKSNKIHKIKIHSYNVNSLGNAIYLKSGKKIAIIKNVKLINIKNEFLYFRSLGEVKIIFDCSEIYRYYNIKILSTEFKINQLKESAKFDILNNLLDINNATINKKFLFFIKNILKISINNEKINIKSNNLKISYKLFYKLNNKNKKIIINETL